MSESLRVGAEASVPEHANIELSVQYLEMVAASTHTTRSGNMAQGTEQPQLSWEQLNSSRATGGFIKMGWNVHRTKVPGGWLVLVIHNTSGVTFYPDPEHKWNGGSET